MSILQTLLTSQYGDDRRHLSCNDAILFHTVTYIALVRKSLFTPFIIIKMSRIAKLFLLFLNDALRLYKARSQATKVNSGLEKDARKKSSGFTSSGFYISLFNFYIG